VNWVLRQQHDEVGGGETMSELAELGKPKAPRLPNRGCG